MSDVPGESTEACILMLILVVLVRPGLWYALRICLLRVMRALRCWSRVGGQELAHLGHLLKLDQGLPSLLRLVLLVNQMKDKDLGIQLVQSGEQSHYVLVLAYHGLKENALILVHGCHLD